MLYHLQAFRLAAMMTIIILHAYTILLGRPHFELAVAGAPLLTSSIVRTLCIGGTVFFVFLSGLLYTIAMEERGYRRFLRDRVLYVGAPFALLSLFYAIVKFEGGGFRLNIADPFATAAEWALSLFTGDAAFQLWFIPLAFILYLLTPLLAWALRTRAKFLVLGVALAAPLVFTRSADTVTWQAVIYFTGPYALGLFLGQDYKGAIPALRRLVWPFAIVAVGTSAWMLYALLTDVQTAGPNPVRYAVEYINRMAIALAVLPALSAREALFQRPWVDQAARLSFPFYLYHGGVCVVGAALGGGLVAQNGALAPLIGAVIAVAAVCVTIAIVAIARRLFGRASRVLVGA